MSERKQSGRKSKSATNGSAGSAAAIAAKEPPAESKLDRVVRFAEAGDYRSALGLLKETRGDPALSNALGVCLMRSGRAEDAIRVYRMFVLQSGCTWMVPHLPTIYKVNFATALLLGGQAGGCLELLAEINDEQHDSVRRLRQAIAKWERSFGLWAWLNWRLGRIAPAHCPVVLDFPAGDFGIAPRPEQPAEPASPDVSLRTSV